MNEELMQELALELRRKLFDDMEKFWNEHHKLMNMTEIFFINTAVMSSLVSQITYYLFKKDIGLQNQYEYIDQIANVAKSMLKDGAWHTEIGGVQ